MTPIARAAQAMHASAQPEWLWDDPDYAQLRAIYRDAARAMIASLREPSEAMMKAGAEHTTSFAGGGAGYISIGSGESEIGAAKIFGAMIDAMLEEG